VVEHHIFVPAPGTTLDIETTAEAAILNLRSRFALQSVHYDPWQGIGLAQRLGRAGINMTEWPQTLPNLSLIAGNLLELIKRRQLVCYPADDLRQAIGKTVAIEGSRGWRLGKSKASDRVDPIIALAMAALATVKAGKPGPLEIILVPVKPWSSRFDEQPPDRLYARGEDVAAEEDLRDQLARLRRRRYDRWRGF
jgi:hypothetical protein